MNGTDGPAFLGADAGVASLPTLTFDQTMDEVTLDVGLGNLAADTITVTSFLGGVPADTDVIVLADDGNGVGTWQSVISTGPLDEVQISAAGGADFGVDNVVYVVPEPGTVLSLLLGSGVLAGLARRREPRR